MRDAVRSVLAYELGPVGTALVVLAGVVIGVALLPLFLPRKK